MGWRFITGLAASAITVLGADAAPFERVVNTPFGTNAVNATGLAWVDYDSDNRLDLFVSTYGERNRLYKNAGSGEFEEISIGDLVNDNATSLGGVWADYDNDGHLDCFVANLEPNDANVLYRNQGNGVFTRQPIAVFSEDVTRSVSGSWSDMDNDGWVDLFVANSSPGQVNFLYRNLRDRNFARVLGDVIVSEDVRSDIGVWSDFDADGDPDIFVSSEGASLNRLYVNNGTGAFTKVTSGPIPGMGGYSAGAAWGDYNNDRYPDLFVANLHGANNFLYRNNGAGNFARILTGDIVNDGGYTVSCAWGDYDNDGWLDLFVANFMGEKNALYRNDGAGGFIKIQSGSVVTDVGRSRGCAWGDYNDDGFLDLAVSNDGGFPGFLYKNVPSSNRWIKVRCHGTHSNRAAIGAKVYARARIAGSELWQAREISGGTGYGSQNELVAHFGLGEAERVDELQIHWPSGIVQVFTAVPGNQTFVVHEAPILSTPVKRAREFEFTLLSRYGRSYRIEASTDLTHWTAVATRTDVQGAVQVIVPLGDEPNRWFFRAVDIP